MTGRLHGRRVLITGGGSGIGQALAKCLGEMDCSIVIVGRDVAKLLHAARDIPRCTVMQCDVTDAEAVEGLFAQLEQKGLLPDVLINNAGAYMVRPSLNETPDRAAVHAMVQTNVTGPVLMSDAFLAATQPGPERVIVNVSSASALFPIPAIGLYGATKAALHSYSRALRYLARQINVRVVEVLPPGVNTKMLDGQPNQKTAMDPMGFANLVVRKIERGRLQIAPGADSTMMRVLDVIAPRFGIAIVHRLSKGHLGIE